MNWSTPRRIFTQTIKKNLFKSSVFVATMRASGAIRLDWIVLLNLLFKNRSQYQTIRQPINQSHGLSIYLPNYLSEV